MVCVMIVMKEKWVKDSMMVDKREENDRVTSPTKTGKTYGTLEVRLKNTLDDTKQEKHFELLTPCTRFLR